MVSLKILLMGLPGSGKTTLARKLKNLIGAVHFNADEIRNNISRDLDFSPLSRVEQARRMGWLCDQVNAAGHPAIADFVCPTDECRAAFGQCFLVFLDTIMISRYPDTNELFQAPTCPNYIVRSRDAVAESKAIYTLLTCNISFNWRKPTALFVGRYQPFHMGHKTLVMEGIKRVGQACIAVRDTGGIDEKNPYSFAEVRESIDAAMKDAQGKYSILRVPNITDVFYGRDVGYNIEKITLPAEIESVSGTCIRKINHSLTAILQQDVK